MIDPDKGTWHYRYNGFDELIEQTDAKQQQVRQRFTTFSGLIIAPIIKTVLKTIQEKTTSKVTQRGTTTILAPHWPMIMPEVNCAKWSTAKTQTIRAVTVPPRNNVSVITLMNTAVLK